MVHPRTAALSDPDLPAVATLLGAHPPMPLRVAVATAGGTIVSALPIQVSWWPGSSITVRYRVEVDGGELAGPGDYVAAAGAIPSGAMELESEGERVGVWRLPHDPALPGMPAAFDPYRVGRLLDDLGAPGAVVSIDLRAYRPRRRAVVSVTGRRHGLFLKLVRPSKAESLHRHHAYLSERLPVPVSLGFSSDLGVVALQAMAGATLRRSLEEADGLLPDPEEVVALAAGLPEPPHATQAASPIERLPQISTLLTGLAPELTDRVERLVDMIGTENDDALVPVHGDYYEAQVMVLRGRVNGLLDVDTYGWGRRGDDPATMLGHLDLWRHLSRVPERVAAYGAALLRLWDSVCDPVDLRLRVAAVLLTLAPGAFRVQTADWPSETAARIEMAERWVASALSIDETSLISFSG